MYVNFGSIVNKRLKIASSRGMAKEIFQHALTQQALNVKATSIYLLFDVATMSIQH